MLKDEKIVFVLPGSGDVPTGGFKIVYDYANQMALDGREVYITHCVMPFCKSRSEKLLAYLKYLIKLLICKVGPKKWYLLSERVRVLWMPYLTENRFMSFDIIILTSWQTAYVLGGLKERYKKNVIYLIQGYEIWSGSRDEVHQTYFLGLKNVVISSELKSILNSLSVDCHVISNFVEDQFFSEVEFEERNSQSIAFNFHEAESKGTEDIITALEEIRIEFPKLSIEAFGVSHKIKEEWIRYTCSPNRKELRALYNRNRIFISASRAEGWGLMPFEAMQCGCVPIVSNIGGHREFIVNGVNGLFFLPQNIQDLKLQLRYILRHPKVLSRMHVEAKKVKSLFPFKSSYDKLIQVIEK